MNVVRSDPEASATRTACSVGFFSGVSTLLHELQYDHRWIHLTKVRTHLHIRVAIRLGMHG